MRIMLNYTINGITATFISLIENNSKTYIKITQADKGYIGTVDEKNMEKEANYKFTSFVLVNFINIKY